MNGETRAALALLDAGLPRASLGRALDLVLVGETASEAEVKRAVDALVSDLPELFSGRRAGEVPGARRPGGIDARRRAEERYANAQPDFGDPLTRGPGSVTPIEDARSARERAEDRANRVPRTAAEKRAHERYRRSQPKLGQPTAWGPRPGGDAA